MEEPQFAPLERVPFDDWGYPGSFFYIQRMMVRAIDYRVLFFPYETDSSSSNHRLEQELGPVEGNVFEVKFALGRDFENPSGYQFASPSELGLPTLDMAGMNHLGSALVQCIMSFSIEVGADGFVAIALDDKPTLSKYYSRVLRSHEQLFAESGYEARKCLGGHGYALTRTSYSVESARSAGAQA